MTARPTCCKKMVRYNRQAKQRELLERRRADLAALDRRLTLVPDLAMVGTAIIWGDTEAEGDAVGRAG